MKQKQKRDRIQESRLKRKSIIFSLFLILGFVIWGGVVSYVLGNNQECGECDGKMTELTLKYKGNEEALIKVIQKKDKDIVFEDWVEPNEEFSFIGTYKGTLGTEISVYTYLDGDNGCDDDGDDGDDDECNGGEFEIVKIHTSCSQPIEIGMTFGNFEIIAGKSKNGGPLCPPEEENHPPVANNDSVETEKDVDIDIAVLDNDYDPDNNLDPDSLTKISEPMHGTATVSNNQINYLPDNGYIGYDVFHYEICDEKNLCDTAIVTIIINEGPVEENHPPIAENDSVQVLMNNSVEIDVLDNDYDPDENLDRDSLLVIENPSHGLTYVQNNRVTYVPETGYVGEDQFTYEICDDLDLCSTAIGTIYIISLPEENGPPVARNDSAQTEANQDVEIDILDNDYDPDDNLNLNSIRITNAPDFGIVVIENNKAKYTPNNNYVGVDQFNYEICDTEGLCDSAIVTITVTEIPVEENEPPVARNDSVQTQININVEVDVLDNDYDPDGELDLSTLRIVENPSNGLVNISNNKINYTPDNNYTGEDQFTYEICDEEGLCDSAVVAVVVYELPEENEPSVARNDFARVESGQSVEMDVLDNDYDPDDNLDVSSLKIITIPNYGLVVIFEGKVIYYSEEGYVGQDQFTYEICDEEGLCDTAVGTIVVYSIPEENEPPVARNDSTTTLKNTEVEIDVLDNDYDPDGNLDPNSLKIINNPEHGLTAIRGDVVLYTPEGGYVGVDQFNYEICDESDLCVSAIVTVIITDTISLVPPTAQDDLAETRMNRKVKINVMENDLDVDGFLINNSVQVVNNPEDGAIDVEHGYIVYQPDDDYFGEDEFKYEVCDNDGLCDTALVTVKVMSPPESENDAATTNINVSVDIPVLDNDEDPEDELDEDSLKIKTNPSNGNAIIIGDSISYTPDFNFVGTDTFSYEVCDEDDLCDVAQVRVTVQRASVEIETVEEEEEEEEEEVVVTEIPNFFEQEDVLTFGSNQFIRGTQSAVISPQGLIYCTVGELLTVYVEIQAATHAILIDSTTGQEYPLEYDWDLKLWKGEISFDNVGMHKMIIEAWNQLDSYTREINTILVTEPTKIVDEETGNPVPNVIITVYEREEYSKKFNKWNGGAQGQSNPLQVNENGEYSAILKEGEYYFEVEAKGYKKFKSQITKINKKSLVTANIIMEDQSWFGAVFSVFDRFNKNNNFPLSVQDAELPEIRLEQDVEVPTIFAFNEKKEAVNLLEEGELPYVVFAYNKWNTDAEQQINIFEQVAKQHQYEFEFIAISTMDPFNKTRQALSRGEYEIAFYKASNDFYDDYKVISVPEIFLISNNRKLIDSFVGPISIEELKRFLKK
jgi:5-hydroxyisourate hydrolase-like protein (transthyretin family)